MSEPKQVVTAMGSPRKADIDALVSVFFSQWEADDDVPCVVDGVDRVPRGRIVEATADGWSATQRIWDPSDLVETASISVEEASTRLWDLVCAAVERSVRGPTAVSLSGGIDSTLIAAALAEVNGATKIGAISAIYPESPSVDESRYIEETAASLALKSETYTPTSPRMANLATWVDRFDGPTYGLAIGAVDDMNEFAGTRGFRTVLSGEMAELTYDLREHAIGRMVQRRAFGPAIKNLGQLKKRGVPFSSLLRIVGASLTPSSLALQYVDRKPVDPPAAWLDPSFVPGLGRRWDLERPPSRRWRDIQTFFATGPSYPGLEISTIMGDYSAVKTRRPLLDRPLWEFLLSLPPEVKFPDAWTKSLVRRVLSGRAPDSVVWRTDKTVFDEDSRRNADYDGLTQRIDDGFRLPGVDYGELIRSLNGGQLSSFELSLTRSLASIHAFVEVTS